jgi:branched-chain amino acid transport system substrate-binding protein
MFKKEITHSAALRLQVIERLRLAQSNRRALQLGGTVVLATLLLLAVLSWAKTSKAPTVWASPPDQEIRDLSNGSVITIGATLPLTAPGSASDGEAMKVALEIAADEINAAGGVLGMPIQLIISDTAGTPQLGAEAMNYFATVGVVGVVGEYHSAVALTMTVKAHEHHLPVIFAETWHDNITALGYTEVFRIAPAASMFSEVEANYIAELGFDNVVIMTEDSDYGNAAAAAMESRLNEKEIASQTFSATVGTADFTSVISDIQALDPVPQAVIVLATGDDAYNFEQQAAQAGLSPSADTVCIANQNAGDSGAFWQNVPDGNYCVFKHIGPVQAHYNDRTLAFATEYMSRTDKSFVEFYAMEAYDSLIIMTDAISRAGSTDPDAIIVAIEATDLVGAQGRYYFPYGSGHPVPGDVPAYMWHQWPDPYILMIQYFRVNQTPNDAAVVYPAIYRTHGVNLVPYGGLVTSVPTDTESILVYTDTQGSPTVIQVPAGAVTETTTLVYTPVETTTTPSGFAFASHAFDLDAYQGGALVPGLPFSVPVTVTLHYTDTDIAELDENRLVLKYWNDSTSVWEDADCGSYDRHPDDNWLAVPICHLSRLAMFGKYTVYLPIVLKNR